MVLMKKACGVLQATFAFDMEEEKEKEKRMQARQFYYQNRTSSAYLKEVSMQILYLTL